jgi:hypothetical protein
MAREELPLGSPVDFDPSAGEPGNAAEDLGNRDAASAIFDGDAEPWTPPDSWAPINRRGHPMREPVDTFRNLRVTVPRTLDEAFAMLALSLELYETAREVEREARASITSTRSPSPSRRARDRVAPRRRPEVESDGRDARAAALEPHGRAARRFAHGGREARRPRAVRRRVSTPAGYCTARKETPRKRCRSRAGVTTRASSSSDRVEIVDGSSARCAGTERARCGIGGARDDRSTR